MGQPRVAAAVLVVILAATGCSSDDDAVRNTTTSTRGSSGVRYTDCDAIRPGEPVASDAAGIVCAPGPGDTLDAMDCTDGTYIRLVRPTAGDLEGITGRTNWQVAQDVDPELGRTRFGFENCHER